MTPLDFEAYWDLNHKQLAEALGENPQTVRRWFANPATKSYRQPSFEICWKLDQIHAAWLVEQQRQYARRYQGQTNYRYHA